MIGILLCFVLFCQLSACGLQQSEINAIKDSEVKNLYSSLRKYRIICTYKGVNEEDVDTLCISGYDVGKGIVNLIYENKIKKLVMGAAADSHYSRRMSITSKKAKYVSEHAPRGCQMWFICKGKLITTRQGSVDRGNPSSENVPPQEQPDWIPKTQPEKPERKADSTPSPPHPHEFKCPITLEIMRNPYQAADGYTYEAEAIKEHLRKGGKNSPTTNLPLDNYHLTPNRTLATMIKDWLEKNPNHKD